MIIYNAKIFTVNAKDEVIKNGFVKFGEKIGLIGDMRECPPVCENDYDAGGANVLPGFIDAHSHVGVWEDASGFECDDGNEVSDPCMPHLRAVDMVNPRDKCFIEAARAGVTAAAAGPGSANVISGSFLTIKTGGGNKIEDLIIKSPSAIKFAFGENPKYAYSQRDESPKTRMATAAIIREQLYKAKRYLETVERRNEDSEIDLPEYDIKCEALIPLLKREIPAQAHCHRADDIFTAIRIAREFELDISVIHATDAALIADDLAKEKVPVILGPLFCDRGKPELANHSIETAAVLSNKGVMFALCTDHPEVPVQYLPLTAGLAIRGGLSESGALRAITADAAKICGIDRRLGSIEAGKDADLVVFAGRFFDVLETPKAVFINGVKIL